MTYCGNAPKIPHSSPKLVWVELSFLQCLTCSLCTDFTVEQLYSCGKASTTFFLFPTLQLVNAGVCFFCPDDVVVC